MEDKISELSPLPTINVMGRERPQIWFTATEVDTLRRAAIEPYAKRIAELEAELEQRETLRANQYLSVTDAMGYEAESEVSPEEWAAQLLADRQRKAKPFAWTVLGVEFPSSWTCFGSDAERVARNNARELGKGFQAAPLYLTSQPAEPNEEHLAMEAVMHSVDPATWPGLTVAQRCSLGRFAKPEAGNPTKLAVLQRSCRQNMQSVAPPISDVMMDLADRLGYEYDKVDPRAWEHVLAYAPKPKELFTRQYYYKVDDCKVQDVNSPKCRCWHDLGTGPFKSIVEGETSPSNAFTWRDKPILSESEVLEIIDDIMGSDRAAVASATKHSAAWCRFATEVLRHYGQRVHSCTKLGAGLTVDGTKIDKPQVGSKWKHYNGNLYTVEGFANEHTERHDKYPVMIVYRGENGHTWSRPLALWYKSMRFVAPAKPDPVESKIYQVMDTEDDGDPDVRQLWMDVSYENFHLLLANIHLADIRTRVVRVINEKRDPK